MTEFKTELKWPRKLTIVRHGQSEQNVALDLLENNLENILAEQKKIRDADIKLTDYGIYQAQETGKFLANQEKYDICLCSPSMLTLDAFKEMCFRFIKTPDIFICFIFSA